MANPTAIVPVTRTGYTDTQNYWPIPSTAGTYYPGEMLGILPATGKAYKFDDTAAMIFLGVNTTTPQKVVNTTTPAADLFLRYDRPRLFSMPLATGTASRLTDIGKAVYAAYSNAVTMDPSALSYANLVGYIADILPSVPTDTVTASGGSVLIAPPEHGAYRDGGDLVQATYCWTAAKLAVDSTFFTASRAYRVVDITGRVDVVGSDGSAVTAVVRKAASGTALTSGTLLHSGSFDLKGTAAANQSLTLSSTLADLNLAAGDSLVFDLTGTSTAAVGALTVLLKAL